MTPKRTPALLHLARPRTGELRRLVLSVALATGAALAAIALLGSSGYLISRAAQRPPILALMVTIVAVRAFGLTRAVLRYGERLASHDLALRQLSRLRQHFYRSLVPLIPSGLENRSGDLLSRFVADIDTLKDLYLRVVIPGLVSLLVLIAATLAAWLMLPAAGLTMLLSLTLAILLLPWLSSTVVSRAARRQAPARAHLTSELIESIDGVGELVLAGQAHARAGHLSESDDRLARIARSDAIASFAAATAGGVLAGFGVLALLLVTIPAVHSGALSGVLLAALVFLMLAAYENILPLSAAARSLRVCSTAAVRLQEIALQPPAVEDPLCAPELSGIGELRCEHISFGYEPDQPWVLEDLQLRIAPGEHVALTGASGSGKSTLAELLVRFNDPTHGRLTLDGIDMRELTQSQVRAAIVLCAQDCHVFNTTIRENLLIARRDATDRQISDALAVVELDESGPRSPARLGHTDGSRWRAGIRRAAQAYSPGPCAARRRTPAHPRRADSPPRPSPCPPRDEKDRNACGDRGVLVITHDLTVLGGFDRVLHLRGGALAPCRAVVLSS